MGDLLIQKSAKQIQYIERNMCICLMRDKIKMLKMVIKFDENKIRTDGKYSLDKINDYLNNLVLTRNLIVQENGLYTDSGNEEKDIFSFMVIATAISHREWIKFAKEWLWYENSDIPDDLLKTFEVVCG